MSFDRPGFFFFRFPFRPVRRAIFAAFWVMALVFSSYAGDDVRVDMDPRIQLKIAQRMVRKGELTSAEQLLRRIIAENPSFSEARLRLAHLLLRQKILVEAYDISLDVATKEPKNSYAFAVLGSTLLSSGNFIDAARMLFASLKLNRTEPLALAGVGMLDFYENRIEDSVENLRAAVFFDNEDPDYIFALAQVTARAEKYKEAADAYHRFLEVAPSTDLDRRERIKGLISFLRYLGNRRSLYDLQGSPKSTIPIELVRDRPVITLRVNNHRDPMRFVLDTGSGISVISEETAAKLKIKPITRGGKARAIGGDGRFEIVYGFLKSVNIGEVEIDHVPVYIRKFYGSSERIDGYIGLSLISKFLTTIDYGDRTFTLERKGKAPRKLVVDENDLLLPLRLTSSGFLSGEVQLDGLQDQLNFIVDTGASISVISNEVAGRDEIMRHIRNERMRVVGAAGVTENVPMFVLPKLSFGSNTREQVAAIALDLNVINEASGFRQAGILGGNFLKNYRMTFDFQNSKVIFEPLDAPDER